MEGESPTQGNTPAGAVFLSYASEDAEAARRVCDALRAAGIEVWLDQSELRGGDAWDRQIRERIHSCRLFIALISNHTQARDEGYFRREWKLAVDRTHDMLEQKAFLLPVVIDGTPERGAAVPDKFHEVQWTRLPGGKAPPEFVARIKRLLSPEPPTAARLRADAGSGSSPIHLTTGRPSPLKRALPVAVAVLILAALTYLLINQPWISKPAGPAATSNAKSFPAPLAAFNPPPHSVAVLPFVNLSGDKEQEYFSDGLTEELLNSLAEIEGLQVAARTSSFTFREHPDIVTVAHKLNVATVLEGSVRRSENTVRVTTQLINAVTGFHLWSHTYDRNLGDVLKLQTDIADAVASALKVSLLGDVATKIELGGTRNPAAFDAYLRGSKAIFSGHGTSSYQDAIDAYTEAIHMDPSYALAFAGRSNAYSAYAGDFATGKMVREFLDKSQADARQALNLAPELAEGHLALASYFQRGTLDFARASESFERAMALAPGNAVVLGEGGRFAARIGRFDAGVAATRRAVVLDPLGAGSRALLGEALYWARRYEEAVGAYGEAISLDPDYKAAYGFRGLAYYGRGDFQSARSSCESKLDHWASQWCLAVTYDKLGRHADAEAELKKLQAAYGNGGAYTYVTIYAQWGNNAKALEWLPTTLRVPCGCLVKVKTDPLMDPLRNEPRFQAVMRELRFPD
jgi:TolB-like protein/Flp pilus assembly protein TadD